MLELVKAFTIFSRYTQDTYCLGAEHDQIFVYVDADQLPPDSPDGLLLQEMNWWCDDCWTKLV